MIIKAFEKNKASEGVESVQVRGGGRSLWVQRTWPGVLMSLRDLLSILWDR